MPGPGVDPFVQTWELLSEPVFKGLIPGFLGEYWRPARASNIEDESVGSFLERRFGNSDIIDNIASALLHGIYAGDIYQLSAKSLFPLLWEAERRSGSLMKWSLDRFSNDKAKASSLVQRRDFDLLMEMKKDQDLLEFTRDLAPMSLWSFPDGITTLSDALADALKANPKVTVKMNEELMTVALDESTNHAKVRTQPHLTGPFADDIDYYTKPPFTRPVRSHHLHNIWQVSKSPDPKFYSFPQQNPLRNRHGRQSLLCWYLPPSRRRVWLPHPSLHSP